MKIALIKTKSEKITPLQDMNHPSSAKRTYQIKTAKLVQVFAARWRSIRKYFNSPENKRLEKQRKLHQHYRKNATRLYSGRKPKEDLEQSSQSH